ncbi:MAG: nitroreductase family protein [Deltaproteobacteria bacterium]|uniref:Nitroreductase family protein n=1 Tax=Candidatus Zymogenus saltonus TaxID=2844893 RepID=A0A9D8KAK7_9DELT|nr:nitroreductase family protein [Candidatus Zymogenus saltonus]
MTTIIQETCRRCGLCAEVCSAKIIREVDGRYEYQPYPDWACFKCGLCMAVCPTKSIIVEGLDYRDFPALKKKNVDFDSLYQMLLGRRSIRSYKKDKVPRNVIKSIVDAAATAPMGVPPSMVELTIFDKRADMEALIDMIAKEYEGLLWIMKTPMRLILRLMHGKIMYDVLREHVVPAAGICIEERKRGRDVITYDAPVLILFHINPHGASNMEDVWIAATYASIGAQSLGLGSCFIGMIPPVVERSKKIKEKFRIPVENRVLAAMILGIPAVKFKRSVPRELGGVAYVS